MAPAARLMRGRYKDLIHEIEADLNDYKQLGYIRRAKELAETTGQYLNDDHLPQYFTGDLDSPVVLIHLNPKDDLPAFDTVSPAENLDSYLDAHSHFGSYMYGPESPQTHKSPFDAKQVRFLRQLGVLDFVEQQTAADRYLNLQRAVDDKLQLELVPYSSRTFDTAGFARSDLSSHFDRLRTVIGQVKRSYVLFCGSVFEPLVEDWIAQHHEFHLTKKDGTKEKQKSRFANLRISDGKETIRAGLCQSWPRQGIPMESYGQEVQARY